MHTYRHNSLTQSVTRSHSVPWLSFDQTWANLFLVVLQQRGLLERFLSAASTVFITATQCTILRIVRLWGPSAGPPLTLSVCLTSCVRPGPQKLDGQTLWRWKWSLPKLLRDTCHNIACRLQLCTSDIFYLSQSTSASYTEHYRALAIMRYTNLRFIYTVSHKKGPNFETV